MAGAILIDDYRAGLAAAGFEHVEVIDSGADLNAYAAVEGQSACCSPAIERGATDLPLASAPCAPTVHSSLADLLRGNAAGAVEAAPPAKSIILLWLWGGPSHLDTFDLKPRAPVEYRGPYAPIDTSAPGVQICELLPRLAERADQYAIIRSLHHTSNDHGIGGTIGLTGSQAGAASLGGPIMPGRLQPTHGSIVSRVLGPGDKLPRFITVGGHLHQGKKPITGEGASYLGPMYDPFRLDYDPDEGVKLPQLKLLASVMRSAPVEGAPAGAAGADDFAFRKRLDDGYTIARRNANVAEITPESFRLFFDFLPAVIAQWHELRLRIGAGFLEEWRVPRRWALDAVTPFETVRVLDPAPTDSLLQEGERNLVRSFPAFAGMQIEERWAGLIDATPDGVPVISEVPALPGLLVASGFSGHGFGLGPGAGHLAADLAMGTTPLVDPAPYRYQRFARAGIPSRRTEIPTGSSA